ncbi:bifunctional glutamate N-acetyltransferase/amino-acid acetyltransferase ArgJ [Pseudonocardia sp. KRD-184]|uniref:Arginine biosynthesis bifunctional protein ArgJ n=1 Tax=Pseudonocardia oceani TaxID=2792013 RepID=A0ABS6UH62_9PSEU|nr:bifunctional glutamate N-acetyltransferase/amino-acid acetyltransferase ArgJ [Pseudonocardia oceani]MBW0089827.1 bifunctional glutamate N-acetyltransferase/amino-acid acetyltransferase ArgJ [Pseudonocardia oceani]MBW0096890.1 bifunctional glutamate N-acetyltransferase/amino-acid acetyltransferase ArgJ [Pseudonocardia oceani]MBW0109586.1 bifunctional glutamate N-acetyltransferase/amino-acid acetyltransferase ArgJ [Pseudonocardia oceani]MBW0123687.1 bifunctional glutamate N-acetyltransferase/a
MSVTSAQGFRASGVAAGIKSSGNPDLALVVNDGPHTAAAGVFTRNKVKAAPVLWSEQVLTSGALRAVVLNSGGANACTGPEGFQVAHATAERAAELLGCGAVEVAICSTGLIGAQLPRDTVLAGVEKAHGALTTGEDAGTAAATAIMTTDTVAKQADAASEAGWRVGGMTKGAGMIAPSMATMLSVLTTDALLDAPELDAALRAAVRVSFDRLDVDGSMSTNDTVLLLSSGASGVRPDPAEFTAAVTDVCRDLARQMQADAEGVTKRITVRVTGAASEDEAVVVARTVARDSLVKTALFGSDANWGRIAAAVGYSDAAVDPDRLDITVNGVPLCVGGVAAGGRTSVDLSGTDILVAVALGLGEGAGEILTTDLSHAYVEENSAYPS